MSIVATLLAILLSIVVAIVAYGYLRARSIISAAVFVIGFGLIWGGWALAAGWNPLAGRPEPQIALRSSEWRCAASHRTQSTALIPAGKALMPVTTEHQVCDRYERR